jgi:hypothetical protein
MDLDASHDEKAAAAMAALRAFNIEAFTLLALALLVTALRSYVRISTVGLRNLWADDYLVLLAAVSCEQPGILCDLLTQTGRLLYRNWVGILCWQHCEGYGEQLHDRCPAGGLAAR